MYFISWQFTNKENSHLNMIFGKKSIYCKENFKIKLGVSSNEPRRDEAAKEKKGGGDRMNTTNECTEHSAHSMV